MLAACSPSPVPSVPVGVVGTEVTKPGGVETFFLDPHQGGRADSLQIAELAWGRLVDVHDLRADGTVGVEPLYRDFVIREEVQTDSTQYRLERNPITSDVRLVVLRTRGAPDRGNGTFESLLADAASPLPGILAKQADGTDRPPFSVVPRNACIVVRFNDLLDDGREQQLALTGAVQVTTGYPPETPFTPRVVFDRHHGGLAGGAFHSTRLLVDMTTSESESADMPTPQPINTLGLPASLNLRDQPNVVLSLPTRRDFGTGRFALVENLAGQALDAASNGPMDASQPSRPIVRALRSGNNRDQNNGFLLDFDAPKLIGRWPLAIENARFDPQGRPGLDFIADLRFDGPCNGAPRRGDVIVSGSNLIEVPEDGAPPDASGLTRDVRLRSLSSTPLSEPGGLAGLGEMRTVFDPGRRVPPACWFAISPRPRVVPATGVSPSAQITLRFTDPMDPTSFKPYDSFMLVRGPTGTNVNARSLVVGEVTAASDLREFSFRQSLPLAHEGEGRVYTLKVISDDTAEVRGITDLAGNTLEYPLPDIEFTIDPEARVYRNGGLVLRYNSTDEVGVVNQPDHRGNVFLDLTEGTLGPREVAFTSAVVDSTVPVPSIMVPFPPGVQTPLSPLGSMVQAVWRYVDVGWSIRDETKYDVDVIGVHWAPIGGKVTQDFFPRFEMRLATSRKIPDEKKATTGISKHPRSGIGSGAVPFEENILSDPRSRQVIVNNRGDGYRIDQSDVFQASSGTRMMPWPMNRRGGPLVSYTWRDTSILRKGGKQGAGVPLEIEVGPPLRLENQKGSFAGPGEIPSVGLPLLMEFRCFPSSTSLGTNPLAISLAINTSVRPNFRAFSTGGINRRGRLVRRNPDLQVFPVGGFNPRSSPPGKPTSFVADNSLYHGQLDVVTRISRGHSIWLDMQANDPHFLPPTVEPELGLQPAGTNVVLEFRGANEFVFYQGNNPFNARTLDAYGDLDEDTVEFANGVRTWTEDLTEITGARYVQIRYSFFANVATRVIPSISSVAIPYEIEIP